MIVYMSREEFYYKGQKTLLSWDFWAFFQDPIHLLKAFGDNINNIML